MGKEEKQNAGQGAGKYTIWDNYRVAFSWMRTMEGPMYFLLHSIYVVLSAIQPFCAMALPGIVVYFLGSGREPGRILLILAGYVFALQGMQVGKGYLNGWCGKAQLLFRIRLGTQLFEASMDADYQSLESAAGQKKLKDAGANIYFGHQRGIEAYLKALGNFLISLFGLLLYSVVIGRQSPGILGLSLLMAGAAAGIHAYADRRGIKYDEKYEKVWRDYNSLGSEVLSSENGKDIRMYHMWNWFAREFEALREEFVYWGHKWWKCCRRNAGLAEKILVSVRDLLVYGYLIREMLSGSIKLSAFLIYVGVAAGFGSWITPLLDALSAILENNKYMGYYRDFLEFAEKPVNGDCPDRARREPIAGAGKPHEIRLEHVSFRYEGNLEDTIHDLSLTIASGEKVALVGMNGAGKSTLIKLICGLYRPSSGRICLDGKDISELSLREYYKEFAVVFQDVSAFSFPLEDNVTCRNRESADRERLRINLQKAGLWEKVQTLEKKEHTYMNRDMDSDGVALSGGELQKLVLARALYKDAPILILDEPAASLDPIAESGLYEKYLEMTREKTSIFISHRLSSTKFCDRILFMEKGRITEEGRHEELLAGQGAYAAIFHTQAQYYSDKAETVPDGL